jgi:beta-xylosidase
MLDFADISRLGRPFAKDPSVVKFGDRYLLYYSLPPFSAELAVAGGPPGWGIGIAESADLRHWTKVGELLPQLGHADEKGLAAPGACILNGQVHLFYQSYGNWAQDAICHAVSDPSNPVFAPTGAWSAGRAIDADVYAHEGRLLLFYATRDPEMHVQMIGVAAAPLESSLGRDSWQDLSLDGPALSPELPWERDCIEAPAVCRHGDTLFMFYAGGYNNAPQQIGCAKSQDGVHWQRLSEEPLLPNGLPGTWNASESGHPGVFVENDGTTFLFYQGNPDNGHTWHLAVARIGWHAGHPVVLAPQSDSQV